ncbi:hypothetical protein [Xenorhabdus anantnagensis]|uniref:Lipoprotein n=1 Tax=Xenorhabdus anantnagensis TaxID=3025875 RepID=A0ABT5LW44_9GAMM|nr:hypothetical protein [Xenorhabdus anantnagensis]MDC9598642.1 hypothetical protein [Xenorhabdus anantnagensis]
MGSSKSGIDIKKLIISIVVMLIFFTACYGYIKDKSREFDRPTQKEVLKTWPILDVIKIIEPERFDEFYTAVRDSYLIKDKDAKNSAIIKNVFSLRKWFDGRLPEILNYASDDATNGFTKYRAKLFTGLLTIDPSGVECFKSLYPGVIGDPDLDRIGKSLGDKMGQKDYMDGIINSIKQPVKANRLPASQVEEALTNIYIELIKRHGDLVTSEDIKELAKNPKLSCEIQRDYYELISKEDSHLSAEITRYLNEPK